MSESTHLWLGSQVSFEASLKAMDKALEKPGFSADSEYDKELTNQFMRMQDGVAVVDVKGSLVEGSAGYGIYFGVLGYDDLRSMLVASVANPNVSAILLNVGSGGGAVAGVNETVQLISRINKIKPVVTYTGSTMASAALWIGASAGYSYVSDTAITGSIGIIRVHAERSKQLEADGIKVTVIRAGAEKALGSAYEPLSTKAQENMQAQADYMYGIFLQHMAAMRGVSPTVADAKFGQGREFVGAQAVEAGLIDKVGTFEDAFMKALTLGAATKTGKNKGKGTVLAANSANVQASDSTTLASLPDNQAIVTGTPSMKLPLTQEHLAAIAAGVTLPELMAGLPEGTAAESATTPEGTTDTAAAAESTAPAAEAPTALSVLQAMLEKATVDTAAAKLEATAATNALNALKTQADAFADIARASVSTMGLHFGVKADTVAAMSNDQILAEHARLSDLFKSKFKVGGVAATTQEEAKAKAEVSPMFAAIVKKSTAK